MRSSPRTGPCDKARAMKAAKAMQQAERTDPHRRNDWLTIIHPRASRMTLFDASPDMAAM